MVLWLLDVTHDYLQIYSLWLVLDPLLAPQFGLLEPGPALGPLQHLRGDATSQAVCRSAESDLGLGRLPRRGGVKLLVIKLMISFQNLTDILGWRAFSTIL